ncbi:MAG: MOSC domain-containing protein [Pseudomonadota bacterium]
MPQVGTVTWLGIRPKRRAPLLTPDEITLDPKRGIIGDRYQGRSGKRQVTLMQAEHLPVVASLLGRQDISAEVFRRNILVAGINLLALKDRTVCIGTAEIEITGACHPCSYIEDVLGAGAYNAVRGHGGVTARVVSAGSVKLGDAIRVA